MITEIVGFSSDDGQSPFWDALGKHFFDLPYAEAERKARWVRPAPKYTRGVLAKYARTVSSASEGAVTDKYL